MIARVIQELTREGQGLVKQIQDNTPKATGISSKSVGYEVKATDTEATLQITAKQFFRVVETGRRPTPDKKPSRAMIENIGAWLKALGKEQKLAWAIAVDINKRGTKLYRDGGKKTVFTNVLEKVDDRLSKSLLDILADDFLDKFMMDLKKNQLI